MVRKGVAAWLKKLESEHSIVLSQTLNKLNKLTSSEETSANELANVILEDPSLTTQVIRVANTAHFNRGGDAVKTVSRAILNIGFDTVRTICMSVKIIEDILKKGSGELLLDTLAASIHCAVQARNLSRQRSSESKEEVFVAALLLHIAELMVLCSGDTIVFQLQHHIKWDDSKKEKDKVAEKLIGVSFKRLAQALAKHWNLGGIFHEVINPSDQLSTKAEAILLGDEVSRLMHKGWGHPEVKSLLSRLALFLDEPTSKVKLLLTESANEASELASRYGSEELRSLIPTQEMSDSESANDLPSVEPNNELQQAILKELVQLMGSKEVSMNSYFQMTLEGISRGVGLERATIAFFNKDKTAVKAKYVIGTGTLAWRENFEFSYETTSENFLFQLFSKSQPVWIGAPEFEDIKQLITSEYRILTGVREFLIAPLKIKTKQIGIIYADLGVSKSALTKPYFDGFRQFTQQVNMFLMVIANKTKGKV